MMAGTNRIWLNVALRSSDPFYKAQNGPDNALQLERGECSQSFMHGLAAFVSRHESGHHRVSEVFYQDEAPRLYERIAVYNPDEALTPSAITKMLDWEIRARHQSLQDAFDAGNKARITCDFDTH
jgi:hypothetical protein